MVVKKWLNIIVDGNSSLGFYWPKIVSEYLEKIIRTFFNNSSEKGANYVERELSLVMYNANSDLGLDVQYIPWTKDVNYFLGILSCLAFNGDEQNQHTLVEGLAEALTMFPRPSNSMTTQEYYDGERYCVVIAARDPVPLRMLVTVPEIRGRFIGTQLHTLKADFYALVEMFVPLAISLSIISPMQHPIFGVIFNMGNNDSPLPNTAISNCRIGHFTILLSRKFKEAHAALCEKKVVTNSSTNKSVESIRRTTDTRIPTDFAYNHQDLFSIVNMVFGEQTIEATKDDRLKSMHIPSSSTSEVGISVPPMVVSITPTSKIGEGSSERLVVEEEQGNEGSVGGNSMSKTVGVGIVDQGDAPLTDNTMFPHSSENTFTVEPYPSPSMLPYASSSNSHPQVPFQLNGFGPLGRPVLGLNNRAPPAPITPQFDPIDFWPPPSPLTYFKDYIHVWEGSMGAKIYKNRLSLHRVKAFRKAASPSTLTIEWSSRLDIAFYLPQKALNHTRNICRGPIDFVFFQLTHFNNLDLYHHLKNKNLCAKIHLPFQILILAPTENKYHYVATVFPRDTIFVEPV